MQVFYNYAPFVLTILGTAVGLTGYYLDMVLQVGSARQIWGGAALLLAMAGFTCGRLIQSLSLSSHTDFLTGLWNRRYFYLRLAEEEARATRKRTPLCVAMIDVDDFKAVNDAFGHAAGDLLLSDLAAIFRESARATDIVARWGGDEFAVIFPETYLPDALGAMERIRRKVEAGFRSYGLTLSAGVILIAPGQDMKDLLIRADQALYQAKSQKNSVMTIAGLRR